MALTVMVTGAAGMLGGKICGLLEQAGHRVVRTGHRPGPGMDAVWDIATQTAPQGPDLQPDSVIHAAAAIGSYGSGLENSGAMAATNVLGSWHVADWCLRRKVKQLVFAGTAAVYGAWDSRPKLEDDAVKPWCAGSYAASKWLAEQALLGFRREGHALAILRLTSLYGPGYGSGLIQRLLQAGRRDAAVRLHPPAGDAFHLLHVHDAATAAVLAVGPGVDGIWNIGGPGLITIESLAGMCGAALGVPVEPVGPPAERPARILNWVDDSKARRELGYQPRCDLPAAIREILSTLPQAGTA